ncbi:hypothetical protein ACX8XP_06895 [Calditrichota bacterium LG25]
MSHAHDFSNHFDFTLAGMGVLAFLVLAHAFPTFFRQQTAPGRKH